MMRTVDVNLGKIDFMGDNPVVDPPELLPGYYLVGWYDGVFYPMGFFVPAVLPSDTVSAPWSKLEVNFGDTVRFNLSYKYRGPGGKSFTLYAAVGNNYGGGGEWSGFADSKGIYPPESTTWRTITDSIIVTMGRAVSPLIAGNFPDNGGRLVELAQKLKEKTDFYYIARGINFAIAGEGALKLKEIAYVHAEGMPAGELKHGTLALIEKGTPVIAICPRDYTFHETLSNVAETKARGALAIGVSDQPQESFDEWIKIPQVEEIFYPLVSIMPLQLLAYHLAVARGLDPDKPRNLAKSVTVT